MKKVLVLIALLCAAIIYPANAQIVNPGGGCTTCVQRAGDTMTGNLIFTGGTGITTPTGTNIYNDGNSTVIDFYNQAYTANNRRMFFALSAGTLTGTFVNDDVTAASNWLLVQGNSAGVTSVGFTGPTTITGTLTTTGIIAPSTTAGIQGTTLGDNANAGSVGECISSTTAAGAVSLTTNTTANLTSIPLTAGNWLMSGTTEIIGTGGAIITSMIGGSSDTSATLNAYQYNWQLIGTVSGNLTRQFNVPNRIINISSPATYYLVEQAIFSAGTLTGGGSITACRIR